jgi:repressor of nif and glnA expression
LEKQDQQDLLVALADETIQSTVIAKVLNERGYEVSRQSVGRFRVKHL